LFDRPTDVGWNAAAGNIFVADGYGNSRIAKFDKTGKYLKSWATKGTEPGQFDTPHPLAIDAQGNLCMADLGNQRIQIFDNDGAFKSQIGNMGAPWRNWTGRILSRFGRRASCRRRSAQSTRSIAATRTNRMSAN
jgi:DNA-binding beta-propeller fold protein YncE